MAFLEAQKLVKEYNRRGKTFRAVDDIDFTIEPGDFVMIEGESGSGKTTFLNLLTGLTDPTSGVVLIGGKPLKNIGADLLDEYPSDLSGGEMRRATIARAVINKPSLIIADEPTGSLDSANTFKVMEIFRDIASEGTAVIVVTHQKETLGYASRVYGMEQGSLKKVI